MVLELVRSLRNKKDTNGGYLRGYYTKTLLAVFSPNLSQILSNSEGDSLSVGEVRYLPDGLQKTFDDCEPTYLVISTSQTEELETACVGLITKDESYVFKLEVTPGTTLVSKEKDNGFRRLLVQKNDEWLEVPNRSEELERFEKTLELIKACNPPDKETFLNNVKQKESHQWLNLNRISENGDFALST